MPGTPEGIRGAAEALDEWSHRQGLPDGARRRLLTALDEVLANIVSHGLHGQPGSIEVELARDGVRLEAVIADEADPFNPLLEPPPDTTASLDARRPGGLGIALVRALADDVRYERRGNRNLLTLTWRLTDRI